MSSIPAPHKQLKERQRQERAALILDTAASVFAEKGYHETAMDDIAARVGVAKGTLYQHFASKEDLVLALFARQFEAMQHMVDQVVASDLPARAKLETILLRMYQSFVRRETQLMWALYDSIEIRKGVLKERLRIRERMDRLMPVLERIFAEGKAAGEFDPMISTTVMLMTFVSLLSPRGYEWLLAREAFSPEELVNQVAHTFFQGILVNTERE